MSELSTIVFSTGTSLIAQAASFVITRYPDSYGDKNLSMVIWHTGEMASFDDRLQESFANLRGLRTCTERVAPQVEVLSNPPQFV